MKSNLKHGRFVEPKSLTDAIRAQRKLDIEIAKIEEQLADDTRATGGLYRDPAEYIRWKSKAKHALRIFRLELRLTVDWITVNQPTVEDLLRRAYEVLKVLELEVDFEEGETALMSELDEHFQISIDRVRNTG